MSNKNDVHPEVLYEAQKPDESFAGSPASRWSPFREAGSRILI